MSDQPLVTQFTACRNEALLLLTVPGTESAPRAARVGGWGGAGKEAATAGGEGGAHRNGHVLGVSACERKRQKERERARDSVSKRREEIKGVASLGGIPKKNMELRNSGN